MNLIRHLACADYRDPQWRACHCTFHKDLLAGTQPGQRITVRLGRIFCPDTPFIHHIALIVIGAQLFKQRVEIEGAAARLVAMVIGNMQDRKSVV